MTIKIIESKELQDGNELGLQTFVSECIRPGERFYQLVLIRENGRIQFPINWENYDESQIRLWYSEIDSQDKFKEIRRLNG